MGLVERRAIYKRRKEIEIESGRFVTALCMPGVEWNQIR
jgi:hypothetical protein